jgi:two-component system sensor histidine kinase DesK
MSISVSFTGETPLRRQAWWLLVAMHVPFVVFVIAQAGLGLAHVTARNVMVALPLAVVATAIQLRHSAAAVVGRRARRWPLSLAILLAIAYVPVPFMATQWTSLQWFAVASLVMLLRGPLALPIVSVVMVANCALFGAIQTGPGAALGPMLWSVGYWAAVQATGVIGLVGATWLVRLMDQLRDARTELADFAIGREQVRISRDLHDLLGQSLTAVSLKGDLAIGLLERQETSRATEEIESLVGIARSTLHDMLHIAHHEPPIALASELERAADLLGATGTEMHVDIDVHKLPSPVDELFAWALREGTTNVLRHSNATSCSIRISRSEAGVRLEIVNDGAMPPSSGGNGLVGLAARAATLSGVAIGRPAGPSQFRLIVDVPEVAA